MQIEELKNGSQAEFEQLLNEFSDMVINTCYGFLNSREDAEDVAQEVFVEVFRSISRFRQEARLSTWITRIAVNKSIDALRRQKRKKRLVDLSSLFLARGGTVSETDPAEPLALNERREILYQALGKLPDKQRTALVLCKIEMLSNKEAAEILRTSVPALEALLHRGRAGLERNLRQYYEKLF